MSDQVITSNLVQKLGHNIKEIRERALFNLVLKLENGYQFDNELARSKEALTKLLEWFLQKDCAHEEVVFTLIKRILMTECGSILINHCDPKAILSELNAITPCVEPKYHPLVNELIEIVTTKRTHFIVPPLVSDIPLSYRSGQSDTCRKITDSVGEPDTDFYKTSGYKTAGTTYRLEEEKRVESAAPSIEVYVGKGSSFEPQSGNKNNYNSPRMYTYDRPNDESFEARNQGSINILSYIPNYYFKWQPLVDTDRSILDSVESSLRNPPQPSVLLHSCEFFMDVLLKDFPAEVFLQRPQIVLLFQDMATSCPSTRINSAVLNCLYDLTQTVLTRINHCNDPCMHFIKDFMPSSTNTGLLTPNSMQSTESSNNDQEVQISENYETLKKYEISTTYFCLSNIQCVVKYLFFKPTSLQEDFSRRKINKVGISNSLLLFERSIFLLKRCFNMGLWAQKTDVEVFRILKLVVEVLQDLGGILDLYRTEAFSNDNNQNCRVVHLCLLNNTALFLKHFMPKENCEKLIPANLQQAISSSLVDITMSKLYPEVYNTLLDYAQSFSSDSKSGLKKFTTIQTVCDSITSCIRFIKSANHPNVYNSIVLAKEGLLSLQFHKNFLFLEHFVDLCSNKLPSSSSETVLYDATEGLVLNLLAHQMEDIREEMYTLCHDKVTKVIGPKLNVTRTGVPGSQILFLLRANILCELALHGLTSTNSQILICAEDMLIYILKCKMLVHEDVWNCVVDALVKAFPILLCFIEKETSLGRQLLSLIDPDSAKVNNFSTAEVLKANIQLLYLGDKFCREEAYSRLCWILSLQTDSKNLLPHLNNLEDRALPNVCQFISPRRVDVNKSLTTDHFYQPSSLHQVMDLINNSNVEPVVRRSALTQISVMMEDSLLHPIFIERLGVESVVELMICAMNEEDYNVYPDSIVPAVSILKNAAFHNPSIREDLSKNEDVFYCVLRGLFMYFTEDRMKDDASALLFLLLFHNYIEGTPSRGNFSVPLIAIEKLKLPFICTSHGEISKHRPQDLIETITSDKWSLKSIQMHWNAELVGGFDKLIQKQSIDYNKIENEEKIFTNDLLRLREYDFEQLKLSSLECSIKNCLKQVNERTSHQAVLDAVNTLIIYLHLYHQTKSNDSNEVLLNQKMKKSLESFLRVLPSSDDDANLLSRILKLLSVLVPFYQNSEEQCWITQILKNPAEPILDLLSVDMKTEEDVKILCRQLLKLITDCACQEQHFLDLYENQKIVIKKDSDLAWWTVIEIITDNLKINDAQHFYNLAFLDSMLTCLVNLTATLGWTSEKRFSIDKNMESIISSLSELVNAFHCGKGPSSTVSVMGLSVTRNVMLILNHILAEMQNTNVKGWDIFFMGNINNDVKNFTTLWSSRDVVLRAASVQLFASLAISPRFSIECINVLKNQNKCLWTMALDLLLDPKEASIVRENAACLLCNISCHVSELFENKKVLLGHLAPMNVKRDVAPSQYLLELLNENNFYAQIETILNCLYTINIPNVRVVNDVKAAEIQKPAILDQRTDVLYTYRENCGYSERSWSSTCDSTNLEINISTPSLVKNVAMLLINLTIVIGKQFVEDLHETGLIKLLFRCLSNPSISIRSTKELSLHCEILEMNATICCFLSKVTQSSVVCLGTILHTKDCIQSFISLLNPRLYDKTIPQLLYLRNKLWSEIFYLMSTLIEYSTSVRTNRTYEAFNIIFETLEYGHKIPFIEVLCESLGALGSCHLQNSALTTLTSLLQAEAHRGLKKNLTSKLNMRDLLDECRVPKTTSENMEKDSEQVKTKALNKFKNMSDLENLYFEQILKHNPPEALDPNEESDEPFTGAEVCKILIQLYDISNVSATMVRNVKKPLIIASITNILCVSHEAKKFAFNSGFLENLTNSLKQFQIRLSLESFDTIRRVAHKKRLAPVLKELDSKIGMMTNFLLEDEVIKSRAAALGLADVIHKLWVWFFVENSYLVNALCLLCTFTTKCFSACHSMPLTSAVAGTGPRKVPSNVSLLHAIINQVEKEMDSVNKMHELTILRLCFRILENCCVVLECRMCIAKSNVLQSFLRAHPAITKKQKPWESVELIWLEFLQIFTTYSEGQTSVAKIPDILELIMQLSLCSKKTTKHVAILVLQNIAFYPPNRPRLLTTDDFLTILITKLENGSDNEKLIVSTIIWAVAANNQRAKVIFRTAGLDLRLQETLKNFQLVVNHSLNNEEIILMENVLALLRQ